MIETEKTQVTNKKPVWIVFVVACAAIFAFLVWNHFRVQKQQNATQSIVQSSRISPGSSSVFERENSPQSLASLPQDLTVPQGSGWSLQKDFKTELPTGFENGLITESKVFILTSKMYSNTNGETETAVRFTSKQDLRTNFLNYLKILGAEQWVLGPNQLLDADKTVLVARKDNDKKKITVQGVPGAAFGTSIITITINVSK